MKKVMNITSWHLFSVCFRHYTCMHISFLNLSHNMLPTVDVRYFKGNINIIWLQSFNQSSVIWCRMNSSNPYIIRKNIEIICKFQLPATVKVSARLCKNKQKENDKWTCQHIAAVHLLHPHPILCSEFCCAWLTDWPARGEGKGRKVRGGRGGREGEGNGKGEGGGSLLPHVNENKIPGLTMIIFLG